MVYLFLKFEFQKIIKYFRSKTLAKVITSGMFLVVLGFISVGIYAFFVSSFRYINLETDPLITLALLLFLYEIFLIILFGITVFSSIVSGIFNLFRGRYDNWLLSSPAYTALPKIVLLRSFFTSLLPAIVLFLPAALALEKVYTLGTFGLFFVLLSVVLFLLTINALTLLSILLVGAIYYGVSKILPVLRFTFGGLVTVLLILTALVATISWKIISNLDLLTLFKNDLAGNTLNIDSIASNFVFLPTHPLAMEIINFQSGNYNEAFINVLTLALFAGVSVILWWITSSFFYPLWQKFQEGSPRITNSEGMSLFSGITYTFKGNSVMALFKKEALVSSRNWKGVLWFVFLLLLWLMQIGANVLFGYNVQKSDSAHELGDKVINLQILQFIIAIYFISSFALRFVFPAFSVEKKTAWVLGSAPLSFRKIFFGKYLFYILFFITLGTVMNYINTNVLNVSFTYAFYSMILFVTTIIFIVTLALSLGAIFPNKDTDDAEAITTSMPGLFFTALALIYGALSDATLYVALKQGTVVPLLSFIVITILLTILLLIKTPTWSKQMTLS